MPRYIYHIKTSEGIKKVVGEKLTVPGLQEFHFFAHKSTNWSLQFHGQFYILSEYNTGMVVSEAKNRKDLSSALLSKCSGNIDIIKRTLLERIEGVNDYMPERIKVVARKEESNV